MDAHILIVTGDPKLGAALNQAARQLGREAILVSPEQLADTEGAGVAIADLHSAREALGRVASLFPRWILAGERSSAADVLAAMRAGARDFLPRDFQEQELAATLARVEDDGEASSAAIELHEKD